VRGNILRHIFNHSLQKFQYFIIITQDDILKLEAVNMKIILTAIGSKYIHTALGLRSIRAYAKAHGIETELIEDTVQTPLLAVLAEITGKEPDVVGLSVHIWNKNYVYSLIRLLRKVMPQLKIIAGGPEVSFEPGRIFNECPQIDYIVMGEGEEVFVSLINALQQNSEPLHILPLKRMVALSAAAARPWLPIWMCLNLLILI
jgi:radical SAM superfamily enzyme YgiQ (UPF0313 family)